MKSIFVQLLITHQKGGTYTFWNPWGGDLDYMQTWLRDLSVGYNFSKVSLSLSGRNMFKIYSADEGQINRIQKTVSASVTVGISLELFLWSSCFRDW